MKLATQFVRWTLLLTMLVAFTGCGDSLLGPPLTGGGTGGGVPEPAPQLGPEIMVVHPDGTVGWTQPPPDWTPNKSGALPGVVEAVRHTVSERVDGLLGGKIQCGRFFLYVPPLAFLGAGTITMTTVDSTVMICDVEISPASLNGFRRPVHLAMCTNGLPVSSDSLTMYWYNPETKEWVDMQADRQLDDDPEFEGGPCPLNMTGVATKLNHFSRYGGGKAGW